MATSITTQEDVIEYGLVTDNEIHSLSTERMKANNWATLHARAWTKILDMLWLRASPIEESDLSDTDELIPATVYMVLHYAYAQGEFMNDDNQSNAGRYWERAIKELQEVRITLAGGETTKGSYDFRRARRM